MDEGDTLEEQIDRWQGEGAAQAGEKHPINVPRAPDHTKSGVWRVLRYVKGRAARGIQRATGAGARRHQTKGGMVD
jgi:hypothetical protein